MSMFPHPRTLRIAHAQGASPRSPVSSIIRSRSGVVLSSTMESSCPRGKDPKVGQKCRPPNALRSGQRRTPATRANAAERLRPGAGLDDSLGTAAKGGFDPLPLALETVFVGQRRMSARLGRWVGQGRVVRRMSETVARAREPGPKQVRKSAAVDPERRTGIAGSS